MSTLHVLFKVAGAEYALPASDVLQMESFTGATPVPGSPPYVAGLVHVRGRVVPVIDLRLRFGEPAVLATLDTRIVVAQREGRVVGLLVDSAREVIKLDPKDTQPTPRVIAEHSQNFVRAVAHVGTRLILLIDLPKILGEEHSHDDRSLPESAEHAAGRRELPA